jgi:Ca2+-binding RTX toxin-like protein
LAVIQGTVFDDGIGWGPSGGLRGTSGDDLIYGYQGDDYLVGLAGNDVLDGGSGADELDGGAGDDIYYVDNANDLVREYDPEDGIDTVYTSVSFTLTSAAGYSSAVENLRLLSDAGAINGTGNDIDNVIHGNDSNNTLSGLGGSDTLIGGGGADTMRGGDGDDFYYVENSGDVAIENANEGLDTVYSTVSFTLGANVENLTLQAAAGAIDGSGNALGNVIQGNEGGNLIRGYDGEDILKGGGGADDLRGGNDDDELYGQSGDDVLRGDGGHDAMYGGTGHDTYWVGSIGDLVTEYAGEGSDTVMSTLDSYTLTANVENLTLTTGLNGTGNALKNHITGNLIDNVIDGGGGADIMEGRQGDDTYFVDNALDAVIESVDQGNDTVLAGVSYTLGAGVSVETLATTNDTGTGAINLTGNGFNNAIRGNNGNNVLVGGFGSDALVGLGGIDTASYQANPAHVVAFLGQNGGVGLAYEFMVVNGGETLVSVDTLMGIENLSGSAFSDTLIGNEGANELRGNGGADTLSGGRGVDTLFGGAGGDVFVWSDTNQTGVTAPTADIIRDFDFAAGDRIDLSQIDANVYAEGNQAFRFIGNANFTLDAATPEPSDVLPGEIRYYYSGNETIIEIQTGTSADVEAVIRLAGVHTPEASWFVL